MYTAALAYCCFRIFAAERGRQHRCFLYCTLAAVYFSFANQQRLLILMVSSFRGE
ncbi:hypothetical protein [Bacillus spizizenii]|uniref:hypothetical protein n=1 Tax=Bacillus spizizenii TaxID=96241 RepID=UPI000869FCE1|nr:hypothetical protein [Bacillus spizizenii]SCV41010.1 hypothetical protein BQ1740_2136 [Bacillus subtilis]